MELQIIQNKIYELRGLKVILDKDLAAMYEVTTGNLNKAVKRNADRFPDDFMFQLTNEEFDLIFQNGTSSWGGTRKLPYAFTEHGVAMLAGLLNSAKAIEVNILIVRAFVTLRQFALGYTELNHKLESFMLESNMQFSEIYQVLTELASQNGETTKTKSGRISGIYQCREIGWACSPCPSFATRGYWLNVCNVARTAVAGFQPCSNTRK